MMENRPAWVMWGCEDVDGAHIFASSSVISGVLEVEQEYLHAGDRLEPITVHERYEFQAELQDFTYATGRNWKEAFARLFGTWNPDEVPRKDIEGRR